MNSDLKRIFRYCYWVLLLGVAIWWSPLFVFGFLLHVNPNYVPNNSVVMLTMFLIGMFIIGVSLPQLRPNRFEAAGLAVFSTILFIYSTWLFFTA